jgi:hypothetical protein
MGNSESNESAAVKRQAEGLSNPMYQGRRNKMSSFLLAKAHAKKKNDRQHCEDKFDVS